MVKKIILNNFIIRNLLVFKKSTLQQKLYALVYLFFYGMGFYHNVVSCIQFFRNTQYMIELNDNYSSFLEEGNKLISHIHSKTKPLKQFSKFNQTMMEHQKNIHNKDSKCKYERKNRCDLQPLRMFVMFIAFEKGITVACISLSRKTIYGCRFRISGFGILVLFGRIFIYSDWYVVCV